MNVLSRMEHFLDRIWPREKQEINDKLDKIMSAITDFQAKVQTTLDKVSADLDSLSGDITALAAQIVALNNSQGTLSASDQAALDSIQTAATALQNKADNIVVPPVAPTQTLSGTTADSTSNVPK